jgi:sigma-B regulation protein RsbU (phosphoserine phosphatase)
MMQAAVTRDSRAEQITKVIFEHAARISRETDISTLLVLNADLARDLVGADRCSLWLLDEGTNEVMTRVAHGLADLRIPAGTGIVGACIRENQTISVNDTSSDPRFLRRVDNTTGYQTLSTLCVPLCADGNVIGAIQLLNKPGGFTDVDAELLRFTALYSASAIQSERLRQAAQEARLLRHELDLARDVQRGLLPQDLKPVPGIEYSGFCRPATSVGGDYYDFLELTGGLFSFTLGDVSGKGIPAAVLMASIQTLLRSVLTRDPLPLSRVMGELNSAVFCCSTADRYTTLFAGMLNEDRTRLTYVNAGHLPPMVVRAGTGGYIDRPGKGWLPIGVIPSTTYPEDTIEVGRGDLIVCFSDGISEATNRHGEMWEGGEIEAVLRKHTEDSVEDVIAAVVKAVDDYSVGAESQFDDMTVIALRIT